MKRILVIDDEADIREIAQASLEITTAWEVMTAASGEEGVAIATSTQPDAILLDMSMPGIDGVAASQQLQRNPATRHIPVIFLTAQLETAERSKYEALGGTAVVVKPFDPGTLAQQIKTALAWTD
ncbi:MAG: response regulator [Synechococcales bacterium]|nr:response regulator [Synechococcales bacterium]